MKALFDGMTKEDLGSVIVQTQSDLEVWIHAWRFLDPLKKYTIEELQKEFKKTSKRI